MAKLTKRSIEAARPPARKPPESDRAHQKRWRWLGDDEVPGFGVKVYGGGRRVFALRYRTRRGRQRMLKLGAFGELTVQQARDVARAEKVQILGGEDPRAIRDREAVGLSTVAGLMKRWLDDYAKAHRRRWKEDERRSNARIVPVLGRLALEDVTPDRVASWHRQHGRTAPVEANRALETFRAAWRWADREGLLPDGLSDPTARVKRYSERGRDRWLTKDEIRRLMKVVQAEPDPYVRAAIPLLLLTGLRKRELLHARWSDVDPERGEIRLRETKSGGAQVRLLPSPAVAILRDLPRAYGSPWVFPSPADSSKPRDDLKRPWSRIRKAAKLDGVTLHDLRRTAGSHMAQAGVPLQVIGKVLGHSHPAVTELYARLASKNERDALETLSRALSDSLALPSPEQKPDALPDVLRALLEVAGEDSTALAEGLRGLGWKNIEA